MLLMAALVVSACTNAHPAASAVAPRITLTRDARGAVEVVGLAADDLARLRRRALSQDAWSALLRVSVAVDSGTAVERPAVLGTYAVDECAVRFVPLFPFDAGRSYQVVFDPAQLAPSGGRFRAGRIAVIVTLPPADRHPATRVEAVYPSAAEVPENQLRLYIYFSAPMSHEEGRDYIQLLDDRGRATADPFLPLDAHLWNTTRTRYTVLFDPGRVKQGILPNEQMGRSLVRGRTYTLVVSERWPDAHGQPLAASFRREFHVGPPEERPLDPAQWRIDPPAAGTRNPVTVSFRRTLDHALLLRALSVRTDRDAVVEGEIHIDRADERWLFTPLAPWPAGAYTLSAASILEDISGNRIGKAFEVDALTNQPGALEPQRAVVPFRVVPLSNVSR